VSSNHSCQTWSLVADIGATNARFARKVSGSNQLLDITTVIVAGHENFTYALSYILASMRENNNWSALPTAACLGLAARVDHEEISFLNSHWHFTRTALNEILQAESIDLINDFAAKGFGVLELSATDWVQVGGKQAQQNKPIAIIGPGTGLGVSMAIPGKNHLTVVDGEGGHVDFAPLDGLEHQIQEILSTQFDRVSAERLLCGAGLINIYKALAKIRDKPAPLATAESISLQGQQGSDPLSEETLSLFCRILGSVAGNLALTAGTLGGVYITGGIVPGMLDFFARSAFRERFEAKGRFSDYLTDIPVRVVTRHDLGLLGAANKLTLAGY
jgi:glucokinase